MLVFNYQPRTLAVPPFKHTLGFYRASKYYLQLFLGPGYDYDDPQGIAAVKLKELDNPKTSRDDDELTVFAVNSGSGQIVYNIGLMSVRLFGNKKTFSQPKGITANRDGLIAVADFGNRRVVKLQYKKGKLKIVSEIPTPGRPFDLCFDSQNNLYVTDYDSSKVYVYSPAGSIIRSFGRVGRAEGEIFHPMGIEVIDAQARHNYYKDAFIVITDNEGRRITRFSLQGRYLGSVNNFDLGLVETRFLYVAVDYFGCIYVTDEINDQIHKFDHHLHYIISEGRSGTAEGEFSAPRGITIWRRYGQVFITEKQGGQYLWVAVDGFVVGCFPEEFTKIQPGTTLAIYITGESKVYIKVMNQLGEEVRDLLNGLRRGPGEFLVFWDGRDERGQLVPEGDYRFIIKLRAIHGHGRRIKKLLKAEVRCRA